MSFIFFLGVIFFKSSGQSTFTPMNGDYLHYIERYEIKSGKLSDKFYSNVKPIGRKDLVELSLNLEKDSLSRLSSVDLFNLMYLQNDSWEWLADNSPNGLSEAKAIQNNTRKPFLKYFLQKKSDFYYHHNEDFDIHISPILHFAYGNDNLTNNAPYTNTRGIEIRGMLNKKLGFYSMFTENQIAYPAYVRDYARLYDGFPYEGFTKVMNSDSTRLVADFFSARGYITFNVLKNLTFQFGHDKNFIGSGIRSMILSDFSAPYLHLKAITQVGRFQYINIFAQAINKQVPVAADGTEQRPPKYFTFHHLSANITKNLNIGLFETIVFGQRKIGFDINYLNPVIFYRYVEGNLGSVDNSIVGMDFKYNFLRSFSLYGQLVLDEFNLKHFKQKGWWATKYSTQIGARYIDALGIRNLDLQAEYNLARPYTYSHNSTYSNYVNYNMPLAHPLGSNFKEFLFIARYQPLNRLTFTYNLMLAKHGEDAGAINWGGNIQRNYNLMRPGEYNNFIGQGNTANIQLMDIGASYMLGHNLFIDASFTNRKLQYVNTSQTINNRVLSLGVRWNIGKRQLLF
ncbi:capsule assembly Wzi family protein [Emticicia sp. 17c]|uniref:capsule assembly Wzi family protein n=1 Tax=Emticicia sp. 17c TaxID=3127704 RepID=UPI00301BCC45